MSLLFLVFKQNGETLLVKLIFSLNSLDVKFREWEYLRELSLFENWLQPDDFSILVDYVFCLVDQISLFIYSSALQINFLTLFVLLWAYFIIFILFKYTHDTSNIEASLFII